MWYDDILKYKKILIKYLSYLEPELIEELRLAGLKMTFFKERYLRDGENFHKNIYPAIKAACDKMGFEVNDVMFFKEKCKEVEDIRDAYRIEIDNRVSYEALLIQTFNYLQNNKNILEKIRNKIKLEENKVSKQETTKEPDKPKEKKETDNSLFIKKDNEIDDFKELLGIEDITIEKNIDDLEKNKGDP